MSSDKYPFPVAVSQLGRQDSREAQNQRAIKWLEAQTGGSIIVVTPQKQLSGDSIKHLVDRPGVGHLTWRGFSAASLSGHRVLYGWPDRKHLNELWGVEMDALVVLEWGVQETADWIEDANPVRLLLDGEVPPVIRTATTSTSNPLPESVTGILECIATWAAGYSSGLKWNEEDKLKADMMNCPERWESVSVEQVRAKCRELGMRPKDVDTVCGLLERRKQGHRFSVRNGYRDFRFN